MLQITLTAVHALATVAASIEPAPYRAFAALIVAVRAPAPTTTRTAAHGGVAVVLQQPRTAADCDLPGQVEAHTTTHRSLRALGASETRQSG